RRAAARRPARRAARLGTGGEPRAEARHGPDLGRADADEHRPIDPDRARGGGGDRGLDPGAARPLVDGLEQRALEVARLRGRDELGVIAAGADPGEDLEAPAAVL